MTSIFKFDVFIDYATADAPWVRDSLLPYLEAAGLRIGIDFRSFKVGHSNLENRGHTLEISQWTILVLTPAWLREDWTGFEAILNQSTDRSGLLRRLLPVTLEKCDLPNTLSTLTQTDLTSKTERPRELERLTNSLRKTLSIKRRRRTSLPVTTRKSEHTQKLPPGVTLTWTQQLSSKISNTTWSRDGELLAITHGRTISVYDTNGSFRHRIQTRPNQQSPLWTSGWSPTQTLLAIASEAQITIHDPIKNEPDQELSTPNATKTHGLSWSTSGTKIALADSRRLHIIDPLDSQLSLQIELPSRHNIRSIAWSPDDNRLAALTPDQLFTIDIANGGIIGQRTIGPSHRVLWTTGALVVSVTHGDILILEDKTLRPLHTLEGHKAAVGPMSLTRDGLILASGSLDNTVRFWSTDNWEEVAAIEAIGCSTYSLEISSKNFLAATGDSEKTVCVWKIDSKQLHASNPKNRAVYYRNAKAVLVGDSSVGKSGLGLVLSGQSYTATDSTHARRVWTFDTNNVALHDGRQETRETFLWDMAGQPSYRLIHQLHLDEVAVALVVFDAKSETDPFAGIGHWERALRTAVRAQGSGALPLRKILVAARTDRSGIAASKERIDAKVHELGFDEYFETSAREGWGIDKLRIALQNAVQWDKLPQVSSTQLFQRIKEFLTNEKSLGRLLSTADDLYFSLLRTTGQDDIDRDQFNICLGRLESRDLIRRLSFGGLVLLQPEYLDVYASAIVNEAKAEPDGLGSIPEQKALLAEFRISKDERFSDAENERLLLVATVETMVRREIALREHEQDGTQLVFPSQLTRENPDLPDPKGKTAILSFEGPTQNIYATMAVRLTHSRLFTKKEMWRNAILFTARTSGTCGIALREYGEGRGEMIVFFSADVSPETRLLFEDYVESHLRTRAISSSVIRRTVVTCLDCSTELSNEMVQKRLSRGHKSLHCPVCERLVSLLTESSHTQDRASSLAEMDRAADEARDREVALISAAAALSTTDFDRWLGGTDTTLALVFISMKEQLTGEAESLDEDERLTQQSRVDLARQLTRNHSGQEIKALGDSLLFAYRVPSQALAFTLELHSALAHSISLKASINLGDIRIGVQDTLSRLVTYTARMDALALENTILISERAMHELEKNPTAMLTNLSWKKYSNTALPGIAGFHTLWSTHVRTASTNSSPAKQPTSSRLVTITLSMDQNEPSSPIAPETWFTNKLGGAVRRLRKESGVMTFDYDSPNIDELLRLAENGLLDTMVTEAGARTVREIHANAECIYEEVPRIDFSQPHLRPVNTTTLEELVSTIDIVLMTTTPIERDAILSLMTPLPRRRAILEGPLKHSTYRIGRFGRYFAAHVESTMGTSGRDGATLTVLDAVSELAPKAVIIPGIAFGVDRKKQRLGDVIIADSVFPYELQRAEKTTFQFRGQSLPCGPILSERFRSGSRDWVLHRPSGQVKIHQGPVLSGEKLVDNSEFRDQLLTAVPRALGGEMEGSGAYASAHRSKVEIILVKGICDWADGHKNDRAQPFAAKAAASLVHHILRKPDVLRELGATDRK
ncbi:hypothetical protein MYSTI_03648 [Myxococcus stipitatus DSM 14675]|uniref:TIR domain-containing protein n=1 Tax=Myxococcus stipitatus (strain DSM 14675 / JCM 12634 / Mx s8) TaxID=1278073 RepID=L7UEU9_MYXSD|nr:hypothetical protein MYSTI_03648 [Myxococcus stipitatus DSM 14675]